MSQETNKDNKAKYNFSYIIASIFLITGLILPWLTGVDSDQLRIVCILLFAVVLWGTEALNPIIVSIAVLVFISLFDILPFSEAAAGLGSTIIWRLIGIFILAQAVKKSGLAQRIVYRVLKLADGKVKKFYFLFLILTFSFIFLIPAVTGRALVMLTMVLGLFTGLKISPPSNLGKIIFISLPVICLISSTSVIVGSSTTIYAIGLMQEMVDYEFNYLGWLIANFPLGLFITIAVYFIMMRLYPPEIEEFPGGREYLNKVIQESGSLTTEEKKVLFVYGILLFLWLSNLAAHYPAELLVSLVLLLPKVGILTWKEATTGIEWGVLILFSAGFAIAKALQETGIITDSAVLVLEYVGNLSPMFLLIILMLLTMVIRFGMNNMLPVVATLIPIVFQLGRTLGINPIWLGLVTLYAASLTFLPAQTSPGVITYAYGYYSTGEMVRATAIINMVMVALVFLAAKFYWPLIGIPLFLER